MKTSLITVVILAGVAGLAPFAIAADTESELKALDQQWSDAYPKGDIAVLKAVEADDYTVVNADGTLTTKAEDIKELADKTFVVKSASTSGVKVRMLGENYACVTGVWKLSGATYKGKDVSGDHRFLDIFEKKGNNWQAIYTQITKIEKK
jgi:ketosteroid isomerase-like protein